MMPGMWLPDPLLWGRHVTPLKNPLPAPTNYLATAGGELVDGKQFLGISSELALCGPFQGLK